MGAHNKKSIASRVKQCRTDMGYTQKELSEIAGISLRSVQRIENAEVMPRMYTLKQLSGHLDFTLEILHDHEPALEGMPIQETRSWSLINIPSSMHLNYGQKIIITLGIGTVLALFLLAFLAQSSSFPETDFELLLLIAGVICCYTTSLLLIWR